MLIKYIPKKPGWNGRLKPEVSEGNKKRLSGVSISHALTLFGLSPHPGSSHSTFKLKKNGSKHRINKILNRRPLKLGIEG